MVCKHCGSQLSINDRKCPFCGVRNEEARKHQEKMEHYEKSFTRTKGEVLQKTRQTKGTVVLLVLIAAVAVLNVLILAARSKTYEIEDWFQKRELAAHRQEYRSEMDELAAEEKYVELYYYMMEKDITYDAGYQDYFLYYDAAGAYKGLLEKLAGYFKDTWNYNTEGELINQIAAEIATLYELASEKKYSYEPETYYTDSAKLVIERILERAEHLIQAAFQLTDGEAEKLSELEQAEIQLLLGRRSGLYE